MGLRVVHNSVAACFVACSALLLFTQAACGDDPTGGSGPGGPPDAMLEFDASAIGGSTSSGGQSGSGGFGAFGGTGGVGATGGVGGTGGTEAYCGGVATPCSLVSNSQCALVTGCKLGGSCTGVSSSCYSQFSSYSCNALQGCYWSSSSKKCSGSSWSCTLFSGSSSCIYQKGCYWDDECEGISAACSTLSVEDCADQPGCHVAY